MSKIMDKLDEYGINDTVIEHTVISLTIQATLGIALAMIFGFTLFAGMLVAGSLAAGIFLGREISQHEFKGGGPKVVKWSYGLTKHWTRDSIMDVAVPVLAMAVLLLIVGMVM